MIDCSNFYISAGWGDFLKRAKQGDIVTHFFRKKNNFIVDVSGKVRPEAVQAKSEGIRFNVGHGVKSFEFDSARRAFGQPDANGQR